MAKNKIMGEISMAMHLKNKGICRKLQENLHRGEKGKSGKNYIIDSSHCVTIGLKSSLTL
jgi:hypothetical protein